MPANVDLTEEVEAAIEKLLPRLESRLVAAVHSALNDKLLSVKEAASIAGVSPGGMQKRIERGLVKAVRVGHSLRIRRSDLLGKGGDA